MPLGVGVGAGLGTGLAWSLCAHAFAAAGRRIGSVAVNHVRLVIAAALLPLVHLVVTGTLTGPVFGVWLSQIATKHAKVGVAATLMALVPAWVLVEDAVVGIRRPGWREIAGVTVALAGVIVLLRALYE